MVDKSLGRCARIWFQVHLTKSKEGAYPTQSQLLKGGDKQFAWTMRIPVRMHRKTAVLCHRESLGVAHRAVMRRVLTACSGAILTDEEDY